MKLTTNQSKALKAALDGRLQRTGLMPTNQRSFIYREPRRPETVALGTINSLVDAKLIERAPKQGDAYEAHVYKITEAGKLEASR